MVVYLLAKEKTNSAHEIGCLEKTKSVLNLGCPCFWFLSSFLLFVVETWERAYVGAKKRRRTHLAMFKDGKESQRDSKKEERNVK